MQRRYGWASAISLLLPMALLSLGLTLRSLLHHHDRETLLTAPVWHANNSSKTAIKLGGQTTRLALYVSRQQNKDEGNRDARVLEPARSLRAAGVERQLQQQQQHGT